MKDAPETTFGTPQLPGQKDEITGVPNKCSACGAVGAVSMVVTDGIKLGIECIECGAEYDEGDAYEAFLRLGAVLNAGTGT